MSRYSYGDLSCKVYIGDLPKYTTERDLEKAFSYYGAIVSVWVARTPPGFGFVEYEDSRDGSGAIKAMDGSMFNGECIRVEHATGKRAGGRGRGNRFDPRDCCYRCGQAGHYAYDCTGHPYQSRSRSRSRRRRSYSRGKWTHSLSRSRSRSHRRRSRSRDRSSSRNRSLERSRSHGRRKSRSLDRRSRSNSRRRSPDVNGAEREASAGRGPRSTSHSATTRD